MSFDLKKPPKYESKVLGSEKTGSKKFTVPRHFIQNTVTHYNYFFNASNKLNEVMARAKIAHREDYTQLLPFYNFNLTETAQYKSDLDSVIYKSTAGILIHDLRNDWIDNLYLLIGKAYYLRNTLDSAYMTFQYVNYAFSPKEKGGYDKVIGSNENEGGNVFSISTNEKKNIVKEVLSRPPSRNESLVWQIKTYLAMDALTEASSLIETLKNDPLFPDRLQSSLEEVQSFYYYKQFAWDSAATHLEKALDNALNKQEVTRWYYLIAQLYERAGRKDLAQKYYNLTIRHTLDPVMEVYARLNSIRQDRNSDPKNIQNAINELIRMGRRDRYLFYRDIIYYTAATIELDQNNPEMAKSLLKRSIQTSSSNPVQKSKSFLALGDIYFNEKKYTPAKGAYDSVNLQYMLPDSAKVLTSRKAALDKIVVQTAILDRQDSLQRIAALPEKERDAFIRSLVKRMRKEQGMTDADQSSRNNPFDTQGNGAPADLFNSGTKSSWPFADASQKGKGIGDFKARWGNRPNVDNWRRQTAVVQAFDRPPVPGMPSDNMAGVDNKMQQTGELTYESLLGNLPLTPEKQRASADSTENALFLAGRAYMSGLEDYYSAIDALEKVIRDFPASAFQEEALFNLYYCYSKVGKPGNQLEIRKLLAAKFPNGKFSGLLASGNRPSPDSVQRLKATKQYENVYNLFIEGDFDQAVARKKQADSLYGQSYWTPQLLYIEGVYYIRQRMDSTARVVLTKILQLYPTSSMAPKTSNLLSVLSRRQEIEDYLTKLQITRPADDAVAVVDDYIPPVKKQPEPPKKDSVTTPPAEEPLKDAKSAVVKNNGKNVKTPVTITPGALRTDSLRVVRNQALIDSLLREDSLALAKASEPTRNANAAAVRTDSVRGSRAPVNIKAGQPVASAPLKVTKNQALIDSIRRADSLTVARLQEASQNALRKDSPLVATPVEKPRLGAADSLKLVQARTKTNGTYSDDPEEPHFAVLVLNKVDPVYVNEARNAFNRYHRERFYGQNIETSPVTLSDDIKLLVIKSFGDAAAAQGYVEKTRKIAQTDIVPWLTPQKYSFLMITAGNLEALQRTKDLTGYKAFLKSAYPAVIF